MLTKATLLEAGRRRTTTAEIDGLGLVHLRSLSEAEWSQYQRDSIDLKTGSVTPRGLATAKARLIALCVADVAGERLFANSDVEAINQLDAKLVAALHAACEQHCGVVETAAKNSATTDGDSSLLSSP